AFSSAVESEIAKGLSKEKDSAKRAEGEKVVKVLTPTLKAGELDVAASIRGPSAANHYGVVAGMKVKDGEAIEKTLREVVAKLPEADQGKIKIDAESSGDVKIHRIEAGKHLDKDAREKFGDSPLYFAFRNDAVLWSLGEDGLGLLKQALSAASAGP